MKTIDLIEKVLDTVLALTEKLDIVVEEIKQQRKSFNKFVMEQHTINKINKVYNVGADASRQFNNSGDKV